MKNKHWRAMVYAPKDGTPIIALHSDCSGVEAIAWGSPLNGDGLEGWFQANMADESSQNYAGWIPCPETEFK